MQNLPVQLANSYGVLRLNEEAACLRARRSNATVRGADSSFI
jgi:hypothetical protein